MKVTTTRGVNRKALGIPTAKPKRKSPDVCTAGKMRWSVTLTPLCRVVSEANRRGHWRAGHKRARLQREAVHAAWMLSPLPAQLLIQHWGCALLTVALTHAGPQMDSDNLARAFKAVRDEVAKLIGVDDADARVEWRCDQKPGGPGVTITIQGGES